MSKKATKGSKVKSVSAKSKPAAARGAAKQSLFNRIKRFPKAAWISVWVVIFGAIGIKLTFFSQAAVFQEVGVHPQASQQPAGSSGRVLDSLIAWNGKIYAGYGDWNLNTGPVALTPWDPKTGTFASTPELISDTEAIDLFRVIGGKLYAPATDPRSSADYAVGDNSSGVAKFTDRQPARMTHVFDMATYDGADLWFFGSKDDNPVTANDSGNHAQAWRSTDGGNTWAKSLDLTSGTDPATSASRLYFGALYKGKLYTQQTDFSVTTYVAYGTPANSWVFGGSGWSKGRAINSAIPFKAQEFAGKLVMKSNPYGGNLLAFDGSNTSTALGSIVDYTITPDGYLYALGYSGSDKVISRTKDLVNWERVVIAPYTSTSIAVLNNFVYVGSSDSRLYRADMNSSASDTTPPSVSLTSPTAGATITGQTTLTARASDAAGIKKVEFYVGSYLVSTASSSYATPGVFTGYWNGTGVPNGLTDVKAISYDTYGNASTATVSVTVSGSVQDTTPPVIKLSSPNETTQFRRSTTFSASATDASGVQQVQIQYDGKIIATGTSSAYTSLKVSRGAHTVVVNARDRAGNVSDYIYNFTR